MYGLPTLDFYKQGHYLYVNNPTDPKDTDYVRDLPYAEYYANDELWKIPWSNQTKGIINSWHGRTFSIVKSGDSWETFAPDAPDALLKTNNDSEFCFKVTPAWRSSPPDYLPFLPSATKSSDGISYCYTRKALASLLYKVHNGELADPKGLLVSRSEGVIAFDVESGEFLANGNEDLVLELETNFPNKDVAQFLSSRGIDVDFMDDITKSSYYGELARNSNTNWQPDGLTIDLFNYQKTAVAFAVQREKLGACCFYEPGLGKTPVGIATGLEFLNRGIAERVVISPPGAVATQWAEEIQKFTNSLPEDIVCLSTNLTYEKREQLYKKARYAKWVIIHHDLLRGDWSLVKHLSNNAYFIADEAHKLTNSKAGIGQASRSFARAAIGTLCLTGTPIRNSVEDWYGLIGDLASPGTLGSFKDFRARYRYKEEINRQRKDGSPVVVYKGAKNVNNLKSRSAPHFIRATKAKVAPKMPPLTVKILELTPPVAYQEALRIAHLEAENCILAGKAEKSEVLEDEATSAAASKLTALGALKALCSSPFLLKESESDSAGFLNQAGLVPDQPGPKVEWLITMAKVLKEEGERALVFTYYKGLFPLITELLDAEGINYVIYNGDTSSKDRDMAVKAFQKPGLDGPTIMLATDAAAEGINLGKSCSIVINLDLPWTPGKLEQRSNRVHRIDGTHNTYLVINLVLAKTVEPYILKGLEAKSLLADALMSEDRSKDILGSDDRVKMDIISSALSDWRRNGSGS